MIVSNLSSFSSFLYPCQWVIGVVMMYMLACHTPWAIRFDNCKLFTLKTCLKNNSAPVSATMLSTSISSTHQNSVVFGHSSVIILQDLYSFCFTFRVVSGVNIGFFFSSAIEQNMWQRRSANDREKYLKIKVLVKVIIN